MDRKLIMSAPQDEESIHYSIGIPSKNPSNYELHKTFSSFSSVFFKLDLVLRRKSIFDLCKKFPIYSKLI